VTSDRTSPVSVAADRAERIWSRLRSGPLSVTQLQLLPAVVVLGILFVLPFALIVVFSVLTEAPPAVGSALTANNYLEFIRTTLYLTIFLDSVKVGVVATCVTLLISYPVAYYLAMTDSRWRRLLLLLVVLPFWINLVVRTYAWRLILGNEGLINYVLVDLLAVRSEPYQLLFSEFAVLVGLVHIFLPFMILPLYTSLSRIDDAQIEAAKNLGANEIQTFVEVTLPQSLPGVASGSAIVFVLGFGSFVVPLLLGGSQNVLIANVIDQVFIGFNNWALGSAIAVGVSATALGIIYLFNRLVGFESGSLPGSGAGTAEVSEE
jgi:spermidine/putrescine transport system permease protein